MPPTSERATACVSAHSLCVTEWGNPLSLQLSSSYGVVNGDIQGKGGEGERSGGLSQEGRGVPL